MITFTWAHGNLVKHGHSLMTRVLIMGLVTTVMSVLYLLINHRTPSVIHANHLFGFEIALPFVPVMIWPYWLTLLMAIATPLFISCRSTFIRGMWANAISFGLNAFIWLLLPVGYPRPNLPADQGLSMAAYQQLIQLDSTLNSFPSGHATLVVLMVWLAWQQPSKRVKTLIFTAGVLGLISIVLVKQHSVVDAVAGALTAAIGVVISGLLLKPNPIKAPAGF